MPIRKEWRDLTRLARKIPHQPNHAAKRIIIKGLLRGFRQLLAKPAPTPTRQQNMTQANLFRSGGE